MQTKSQDCKQQKNSKKKKNIFQSMTHLSNIYRNVLGSAFTVPVSSIPVLFL
jgi:hypothetical protein